MAIKPILFNTEMVRAILDGRKTQTRRIIKDQYYNPLISGDQKWLAPVQSDDILWVRETWCKWWMPHGEWHYCYKASDQNGNKRPKGPEYDDDWETIPWKPSIHMPKEAARIFLRVTDVRAERLQNITDADALKEGVPQDDDFPMDEVYCPTCHGEGTHGALHPVTLGWMSVDCTDCDTAVKRFSHLWDSTIKYNDLPTKGWASNPWVWVIEFERAEQCSLQ